MGFRIWPWNKFRDYKLEIEQKRLEKIQQKDNFDIELNRLVDSLANQHSVICNKDIEITELKSMIVEAGKIIEREREDYKFSLQFIELQKLQKQDLISE